VSTGTVILLVIVLVVIAAVAALASTVTRRRRLGARFGGLARTTRSWQQARAESSSRRRRVNAMGIKPLSNERRSGYERQWTAVQERFIDSPPQAATAAAGLVTAVAAERGYDVSNSDELLADLSVHHGRYLDGYRRATRTTKRATAAATEELRQALLDHRALFQDLLGRSSPSSSAGRQGTGAGQGGTRRQVVPSLQRKPRQRGRDDVTAARP
jgi:hypothetical protein